MLLFHCDKSELGVIAFSCYFIVVKLNLILLLLVIFYLILTNFNAFSIFSYVLCDGLSESQRKIRGLVYFHSHTFYSFR